MSFRQMWLTRSIMRLLDTRFAGVAQGVGTAKILGRIHSAQIRLGSLFLPCSFSVLEGRSVDLLFGLDMLVGSTPVSKLDLTVQKRHQCCIDLSTNTLRVNSTEIPFLSEHELPESVRREGEQAVAGEMGDAATQGIQAGVAPSAGPSTSRSSAAPARSGLGGFPGMGQSLAGMGAATQAASPYPEKDIQTVSCETRTKDSSSSSWLVSALLVIRPSSCWRRLAGT